MPTFSDYTVTDENQAMRMAIAADFVTARREWWLTVKNYGVDAARKGFDQIVAIAKGYQLAVIPIQYPDGQLIERTQDNV